jgi:hypothetical protein
VPQSLRRTSTETIRLHVGRREPDSRRRQDLRRAYQNAIGRGYRCLLFTHRVSLYSFWALALRKPDLLALDELFHHHALATLTGDGFTDAEIARLFPEMGHRFAKTNSRPVTGSMNNHMESTRWYIQHDGGIRVVDVRSINRRLNETPMGALAPGSDMDFPIDVLTRIIRPSGAG